jgi:2,4-dienoyl-CoA reductase-like NADH-dependent reductase (Old Yellow Enzyme family)
MRETTDYIALFTPFELAGKQLRNRITHASMSLLATPAGRVTERLIQYHANRAAGGAALTVTEPLGMMRHQAGSATGASVATRRCGWTEAFRPCG